MVGRGDGGHSGGTGRAEVAEARRVVVVVDARCRGGGRVAQAGGGVAEGRGGDEVGVDAETEAGDGIGCDACLGISVRHLSHRFPAKEDKRLQRRKRAYMEHDYSAWARYYGYLVDALPKRGVDVGSASWKQCHGKHLCAAH